MVDPSGAWSGNAIENLQGQSGGEWPALDDFLQLRKNPRVFEMLVTTFIPHVIGRGERFYKKERCKKLIREIVSVSDEAFVLLAIENSEDKWIEMAKHV